MNPHHPRMPRVKFSWNWLSGSGEEFFLFFKIYFVIISPWKKAWLFIWTNLNSLYPMDALCQVWSKFGPVVLEKKIFKYFHYFLIITPWKRAWPFIWKKTLNPLHPRMLCAKFGSNRPSGSGEEDLNVKSLRTDARTDRRIDGQTDDMRKAHLSLRLRWAKKERSPYTFSIDKQSSKYIINSVNIHIISPLFWSRFFLVLGVEEWDYGC